ncbi:hypothetical protein NO2_1736 [Candidatus Termititenax persephonae]|uniref:Phage tail fiber protein n=1 Tax=Candidatus Termititenax persephonae TaxID=2218525 RepID=A0A388TLP1_9BACT|nr:hypothetical protein NO2_1736 [Candidatus Termititenax persephonae]
MDSKIPTEKAVGDELDKKQDNIGAATSGAAGLMSATDKAKLDGIAGGAQLLPVGTILMYDGTSWADNSTLPGWYQCNKANADAGRTPNLEGQFIVGYGGAITNKSSGGSNALTAAMLPKHTHTIYTNATKNTARTASKTLSGWFAADGDVVADGTLFVVSDNTYKDVTTNDTNDGSKVSMDATHEHTGSANNDNSSTGDSNTSNMPAYYALIYIRRVG